MYRACVVLWLSHVLTGNAAALDPEEGLKTGRYCQFETFSAACDPDEAIVLDRALYGRMELDGVCVKRDYGYVGCQTDVRMLADRRCSGRPTCSIPIPDEMFDRTKPCPDDLTLYLEASYRCVKVINPGVGSCTRTHFVLVRSPSGYLSSYVTNTTLCGSATAPWRVTLEPGQRINMTLIDFSGYQEGALPSHEVHCKVFAIVKDLKTGKSKTVCGMKAAERQEHHVMLSTGNEVEVRIMSKTSPFLLKYEAVGCPDPDVPRGGWFYRDQLNSNKVHVGCEDGSRWTLSCVGFTWIGPRGNCSLSSESMGSLDLTDLPQSSALIIVVGIALVVGCAILAIGVVFLKRRYVSSGSRQALRLPADKMAPPGKEVVYMTSEPRDTGYSVEPPLLRRDFSCVDDNDYAYVDDYEKCHPGHAAAHATSRPNLPPCNSPPAEAIRKGAPPAAGPAEIYNSLDGAQYRYREVATNCSPTRIKRQNTYNSLEINDETKKPFSAS